MRIRPFATVVARWEYPLLNHNVVPVVVADRTGLPRRAWLRARALGNVRFASSQVGRIWLARKQTREVPFIWPNRSSPMKSNTSAPLLPAGRTCPALAAEGSSIAPTSLREAMSPTCEIGSG
jgi:hypothetical protein